MSDELDDEPEDDEPEDDEDVHVYVPTRATRVGPRRWIVRTGTDVRVMRSVDVNEEPPLPAFPEVRPQSGGGRTG